MPEPVCITERRDCLTLEDVLVVKGPVSDGRQLYWSAPDGWTFLPSADVFSAQEVKAGCWELPKAGGEWQNLKSALTEHISWMEGLNDAD